MNKLLVGAAKYFLPRLAVKPLENIQIKDRKKDNEFLKFSDTGSNYIIASNSSNWIKAYYVLNNNEEVIYKIKRSLNPFKLTLNVFDKQKNRVGIIKNKLFKLINIISIFNTVKETNIIIKNSKIGSLKSYTRAFKTTYKLDFNDWKIELSKLGLSKTIKNNEEIIMEVNYKFSLSDGQYYINVYDKDNEFLCLMIAIALEIKSLGYTKY